MGASSKKTSKPSSNKKSLLIIGGIFAAVLLLSFWYYQSQRPNYRDLEKEFVSLNIPGDWAAISSSSNKGTLGLFCWQIEGEACPYLLKEFSAPTKFDLANIDQLKKEMRQQITNLGYNQIESYERCAAANFENNDFTCSVAGTKNGKKIYVAATAQSASGNKGNYIVISLSRE